MNRQEQICLQLVCNCSITVWMYIGYLDSCDIRGNSRDSSDSKQEKNMSARLCNSLYQQKELCFGIQIDGRPTSIQHGLQYFQDHSLVDKSAAADMDGCSGWL